MTKQMPKWICACAVLALFVLAACSGDTLAPPAGTPSTPVGSAATATPPINPSANPLGADPQPSPSKSGAAKSPGPCQAYTVYSFNAGAPGSNYIQAVPRSQRRWGPDCERLNAGDGCQVGWQAGYTVLDPQGAHVTFQVWAQGRDTPVVNERVGPIPSQGEARNWTFPLVVPDTTEIAMRLVLEDSTKAPVAVSDTYVYRVDCVAPAPR